MTVDEIAAQIKNFIEREFPNPGAPLRGSTNLLQDWFVDSFGIVSATLFLEKNFGISIKRADINAANFRDIDSLSRYVAERTNAGGNP